jgi:hypothetical protein
MSLYIPVSGPLLPFYSAATSTGRTQPKPHTILVATQPGTGTSVCINESAGPDATAPYPASSVVWVTAPIVRYSDYTTHFQDGRFR